MTRRTRINRFGRAVDELGRPVKDKSGTPDTCDHCGRPMNASVPTRHGRMHPSCAEDQ